MATTTPINDALPYDASEDIGSNQSDNATMGDVIAQRFGRRDLLRGVLATTAMTAVASVAGGMLQPAAAENGSKFSFKEISHGVDETHHVAPGYSADVLIRWGDAVMPDAPAFDPTKQTAESQLRQFGYNNDFIGFAPLPMGSNNAEHGLLCVNHEYTSHDVMFPGLGRQNTKEVNFRDYTKEITDIELAAHGGSVVEIRKTGGKWTVVKNSTYARRITPLRTEMRVSGPAAGHARMKTKDDPTGTKVIGTLNNCAGGMTPWGTYLTAEENFNGYFWGKAEGHPDEALLKRYGAPGGWYPWGKFYDRFDVAKERNEINRFGWIVEIDPYDPTSTPVKRTALGRFKHEGCETIVNGDGRVVVYSGDDERFDYVYKFVTAGRYNPTDRAANRDLLDSGTLFVAKFEANGGVTWMPIVFGEGPLTAANGFDSQADVLIQVRRAGDLFGATKMDRPEDVEPNPRNGKVYLALTNNSSRKADQLDGPNSRAANEWGQIIELTPANGDHAATTGKWEVLVLAGNPADPRTGAKWNAATTANGWFACPDNVAVDHQGRLWVTTDQGEAWKKASGTADGVWALDTEGAARGTSKHFYRVPVGAEMCGPCFAPDDRTLFVAVQHPATDGAKEFAPFGKESTYENPATRWPDFKADMPTRPSVVAITKQDGGVIGS